MKKLFCLFALLATVTARAADAPLSTIEFTRTFARTLSDAAPTYKVRPSRELQVVVTDPKGNEETIFLYDAYEEYRTSPNDAEKIMRKRFLSVVATGDEVFKLDRSRIVPVVKPRSWLQDVKEAAKAKGAPEPAEMVYDDLNDQLIAVYAEDTPNTLRYVVPEQLEEIHLPREELRTLAAANLQKILGRVDLRPSPLVQIVKADGNYEACLIAVPEFWTGGRIHVDGEIVVAIPARDHLLITGSKNAAGLAKMREVAARVAQESPQRLTDTLFVYRDGRFVEFKD